MFRQVQVHDPSQSTGTRFPCLKLIKLELPHFVTSTKQLPTGECKNRFSAGMEKEGTREYMKSGKGWISDIRQCPFLSTSVSGIPYYSFISSSRHVVFS